MPILLIPTILWIFNPRIPPGALGLALGGPRHRLLGLEPHRGGASQGLHQWPGAFESVTGWT